MAKNENKTRYYFIHDGTGQIWTERHTEEEVDNILNCGEIIDCISKEIFLKFKEDGHDCEIN